MDVTVRITQPTEDSNPSISITASGATHTDVFRALLAAAENLAGRDIAAQLEANGASREMAEYAAPLRTRLITIETLLELEFRRLDLVRLDLTP